MQRWNDADADPNNRIGYWKQWNHDQAALHGADNDLPARIDADGNDIPQNDTTTPGVYADRRDRPCVTYFRTPEGRWKPSRLKPGDDIDCGGLPLRVIGPGSGRTTVEGYYYDWFGDERVPLDAGYVSDRAPLNSVEVAMPIDEEDAP